MARHPKGRGDSSSSGSSADSASPPRTTPKHSHTSHSRASHTSRPSHSTVHARQYSSHSSGSSSSSWSARRRSEEGELLGMYRLDKAVSPASGSGSPTAPVFRRRPSPWALVRSRVRSPRRALTILVGLIAACALMLFIADPQEGLAGDVVDYFFWAVTYEHGDPNCEFFSPVKAYEHDLERLRALFPHAARGLYDDTHDAHTNNNSTPVPKHTRSGHVFSPSGHLVMSTDPRAPHPIPQLLALGEKRWEDLLARRSQTLGDAVREYTKRYKRPPPRGFDRWWAFAMENNVVLPDEYDRINVDLAPFRALPKDELQRRIKVVEDMPGVFTLEVKKGKVDYEIKDRTGLKYRGTRPRAKALAEFFRRFASHIPDLRITFSIFDQPQLYLPHTTQTELLKLAEEGKQSAHRYRDEPNVDVRLPDSCAPDSNLVRDPIMREGKSFVYDSLQSADMCQNPYLVHSHGLYIEPHNAHSEPLPHTELLPVFGLAKTAINADILTTPLEQFHDVVYNDRAWEDKHDHRLVWRGRPTGIAMMNKDVRWRDGHRVRLHRFANNLTDDPYEFIVPDLGQQHPGQETDDEHTGRPHVTRDVSDSERRAPKLGYKKETHTQETVFDHFFNIKLGPSPVQCDKADGTCDELVNEIDFAPKQRVSAVYKHKFILDVDGNGWSGRFRRLMRSNSLVIKSSVFNEWFQPHLIPWFMYVPARIDYSDLADTMAFFAGSPSHPDLAFDETAKALAANGKCFVNRMFRYQDMQAYMIRLLLEYARLVGNGDMDFHYDPAIHGGESEMPEDDPEGDPEADPVE